MARRRYQQGKIIKVGKIRPRFVLRWRDDVLNGDGTVSRPERKTFLGYADELGTQKMARRKADLILAKVNAVDRTIGRTAYFQDFAARWSEVMLKTQKPSSGASARLHISGHLVPAFGAMRLEDLRLEEVQAFASRLNRSRKTTLNILSTFRAILRTAKAWGYSVAAWEMRDVALPPRPPQSVGVWSVEEARAILATAQQPWRALFALVAMTGLRAGEALALSVDDLDFNAETITVKRSVTRRRFSAPKTVGSARTVPMAPRLALVLREHLAVTWRINPMGLLFCSMAGGPLESQKVVRKYLRPVLKKLGLPLRGLHAFRHGMASMMPLVGASPAVAQKQLGHSDARITVGIYSHVMGDEQRRAAEKVAALLWPDVAQGTAKAMIQ